MFARHDLAWLSGAGWDQVLGSAAPEHALAVDRWRQAGWPLVVRRADAVQLPGQIALGLALPPRPGGGRKVRVPCRVDVGQVCRHAPPLPLEQVIAVPTAPLPPGQVLSEAATVLPQWQRALTALAAQAATQGIALRVYGSLALQHLTGQAYLTARSDIDLLAQPRSLAELDAALALLQAHAASLPLDGEIDFPGGWAVAWKEWAAARASAPGSRVLVKTMDRVALVTTDALLATLEKAPCVAT